MTDESPVSGDVCEVFSGIQGEGLTVGERQVFVRLSGCNLRCCYCDTPGSRLRSETFRIEQTPGARDFNIVSNPVSAHDLARAVESLDSTRLHRRVALTGGEPLIQPGFVLELAALLKTRGRSVMLETNGTLTDDLDRILPVVDMISMDVKLPTSSGIPDLMPVHQIFLNKALASDVYVKIVVTADTTSAELSTAVRMIRSVDAGIPVVLQPVTPFAGVRSPSPAQVLEWQAECLKYLCDVRVIPQCHKLLGQL